MKWENLKKNKCPQCNKDFLKGLKTIPVSGEQLMLHPCGFKITEQRYKEVVSSMVSKELKQ